MSEVTITLQEGARRRLQVQVLEPSGVGKQVRVRYTQVLEAGQSTTVYLTQPRTVFLSDIEPSFIPLLPDPQ